VPMPAPDAVDDTDGGGTDKDAGHEGGRGKDGATHMKPPAMPVAPKRRGSPAKNPKRRVVRRGARQQWQGQDAHGRHMLRPPAAPLVRKQFVGSPGPWNETPKPDVVHVHRGKPMPPELAPGLDLYGTNEGLTLFEEEGEEEESGAVTEGGSEVSVDDVGGMVTPENRKANALLQNPSSVQKMMQRMRRKLKEQEEYIGELEDQILALNERVGVNDTGP
jgi:hypothetical protein